MSPTHRCACKSLLREMSDKHTASVAKTCQRRCCPEVLGTSVVDNSWTVLLKSVGEELCLLYSSFLQHVCATCLTALFRYSPTLCLYNASLQQDDHVKDARLWLQKRPAKASQSHAPATKPTLREAANAKHLDAHTNSNITRKHVLNQAANGDITKCCPCFFICTDTTHPQCQGSSPPARKK